MGVYIKGMEAPEHCGYCRFRYDGICHALQKTQYSMEECPLVPVPPHGRLIDADKLMQEMRLFIKENMLSRDDARELLETIEDAPTVIEAEEEGT